MYKAKRFIDRFASVLMILLWTKFRDNEWYDRNRYSLRICRAKI